MMAPPKVNNESGNSSDQSDSMGRTDKDNDEGEEEEIPMKQPVLDDDGDEAAGAEADESFLDDDFLSFDAAGADGGGGGENLSGRKRDRSVSPMPNNKNRGDDRGRRCVPIKKPPAVPWLNADDAAAASRKPPPPQQQQPQWNRNRGYGGDGGRAPSMMPPPPRVPPLIRLHNEIVSFAKLMEPTEGEMKARERMVERVTKLAHGAFGGEDKCQVLPFGSQVTELCLPGSDIDFVIRFPKSNNNGKGASKKSDEDQEDFSTPNPLHRFADAVRAEFGVRSELEEGDVSAAPAAGENGDDAGEPDWGGEHLSYLEVIEQTRVPLVKFTVASPSSDIDVDVCFDQPHGPESADLMHRFMESMPPLRPLTFVLKHFLASRDINKPFTGGIGSYLLQLMIVSFLQHRAREDMRNWRVAGGKHCNLGSLLLDFLELYGQDFNYLTVGVSVRHDGFYFARGDPSRKKHFYNPSRQFAIAMENPLDPTADVGGGAFRMQMIVRIFGHAFRTLLAYVSEPCEPTESVLATIIPPTEEMGRRMEMKRGAAGGAAAGDAEDDVLSGDKIGDGKRRGRKGSRDRNDNQRRKKEGKKRRRDEGRPKQSRRDSSGSKNKRRKEKRHGK